MTPRFQRLFPALTITLLSAGILLRFIGYLESGSLWFDEAMLALNVVEKNFIELLGPLEFQQIAPPLFLVLAKSATIVFGENEFALRLIPLLASLLSLIVFYLLLKRAFGPALLIVPLGLFAFAECRFYSTLPNSSNTARPSHLRYDGIAFAQANRIRSSTTDDSCPVIVIGCVSIFFSHTAILVLGACGVCISPPCINRANPCGFGLRPSRPHRHLLDQLFSVHTRFWGGGRN